MSGEYLAFVNTEDLAHLQDQVRETVAATGAMAILLLDTSGIVLACAGEPPLHPAQTGAMAAGIYAAMRTITSTTGAEAFTVCVPTDRLFLEFLRVNDRLVLLGVSNEADTATTAMRGLAPRAERTLAGAIMRAQDAAAVSDDDATAPATLREVARQLTSADFIVSKLGELFQHR
jgi:hypothetical protein